MADSSNPSEKVQCHQLPNGRTVPSWWTEQGWATTSTQEENTLRQWSRFGGKLTPPSPLDLAQTRNIAKVLITSNLNSAVSEAHCLIKEVMLHTTHAQYDYKMLDMQTEIEMILGDSIHEETISRAKKVIKLAPKWALGYYRLGVITAFVCKVHPPYASLQTLAR